MKKTLTSILSLALVLTAAGCGGNQPAATPAAGDGKAAAPAAPAASGDAKKEASKDPVKLRVAWWGGQARHDYTLKVIDMYMKLHPNVKIETEYSSFDDYWKKLAPQAAANQLPDVIQMDYAYITQYADRNQLVDLNPYTKNGLLDMSSVSKDIIDVGSINGKYYAVTLGVNALGSFVDMDMMKKAGVDYNKTGATWDDLESYAQKLKSTGKLLSQGYAYDVYFNYFLRTNGQSLFKADGTALGYTDDKLFVDYFKRYQKWYEAGYVLPLDKAAQKKGVPEDDELAFGNSATVQAWSNQFLAHGMAAKRPLELVPPPGPNINKGLFMKPSQYFSVTSNSKLKDEAVKFIDYFTNDIEANKIIKGERGVPISSKVKEALKPLLSPEEAKIFDYVAWAEKNSSPNDPPDPVGASEVRTVLLKDLGDQILYKKISIEDAAAKFRKDANAVLAKNKK
ncbi:ABC transporter substrate-binding protein [Paenibacillus thalictri]|uniref:Extracellular solute-binding protein n=1 Tax=Paenibacillus thalictri TaxID=2527873 RepID=A0A4Q9DSU9_9BACL|nr:extracellular solute-binding protein [Paenibacillus thalictri]TBL79974.1 extracellular solute-binding protein [Paenibacillus thalictri]